MLAFKIFAKWEDGATFNRVEMGCPYYDEHPDEAEKRYKGVINSFEFSGSLHGKCLICKVTPFEITESEVCYVDKSRRNNLQ